MYFCKNTSCHKYKLAAANWVLDNVPIVYKLVIERAKLICIGV